MRWGGIKIHLAGNHYPADGPGHTPMWECADGHHLPGVARTWQNSTVGQTASGVGNGNRHNPSAHSTLRSIVFDAEG